MMSVFGALSEILAASNVWWSIVLLLSVDRGEDVVELCRRDLSSL